MRIKEQYQKWVNTSPITFLLFISGLLLSTSCFLLVNSGRFSGHNAFLDSFLFLFFGVLVSIGWTSFHWLMYAIPSSRSESSSALIISGGLMLVADAFIRIPSLFYAQSSTDPVAVMFIPFVVGIPVYFIYKLLKY